MPMNWNKKMFSKSAGQHRFLFIHRFHFLSSFKMSHLPSVCHQGNLFIYYDRYAFGLNEVLHLFIVFCLNNIRKINIGLSNVVYATSSLNQRSILKLTEKNNVRI